MAKFDVAPPFSGPRILKLLFFPFWLGPTLCSCPSAFLSWRSFPGSAPFCTRTLVDTLNPYAGLFCTSIQFSTVLTRVSIPVMRLLPALSSRVVRIEAFPGISSIGAFLPPALTSFDRRAAPTLAKLPNVPFNVLPPPPRPRDFPDFVFFSFREGESCASHFHLLASVVVVVRIRRVTPEDRPPYFIFPVSAFIGEVLYRQMEFTPQSSSKAPFLIRLGRFFSSTSRRLVLSASAGRSSKFAPLLRL